MKKKLLTILQIEIALGVITYFAVDMYAKGQIGDLLDALHTASQQWLLLAVGISLFAVCLMICSWRWKVLLEAQGIKLSYGRTTMLYFIGQFFNAFMPGATNGDIFKAIYISRETNTKKTAAVATVFVDRIIGMLALVLLTAIVTLARLDWFLFNPDPEAVATTRAVAIFNFVLLVGMVVGLTVVFAQNIFERFAFFRKLEEKTALGKIISKLYNAFHACVKSRAVLAKTLIASLLNHITFIFTAVCIGTSLGANVSIVEYFTVFPVINAIAAIPVTPGSLGTREIAAVFLLGLVGVAQPTAVTISLLLYLSTIVWSGVGGVVYLFYVARQGKLPVSDEIADKPENSDS